MEEPDYYCMCDALVEYQLDLILVDKRQVYDDNGVWIPVYFRVRDCADLVYENDTYALYRMYW